MRLRYQCGARELARRRGAFEAAHVRILSNSLRACLASWNDPGDYPGGAASAPRDSHTVLAAIDGDLVLEIPPAIVEEIGEDRDAWHEYFLAQFGTLCPAIADCPFGVRAVRIAYEYQGTCRFRCWLDDFEYWAK